MASAGCTFCKGVAGDVPAWEVYADAEVYAFLDKNPVAEYHTLVVPRHHYGNIYDTPTDMLGNLMTAVQRIAALYRERLGITSVQVRNSSGADAGQDVFHIHFHLVPRRPGDDYTSWVPHPEWRSRLPALLAPLR